MYMEGKIMQAIQAKYSPVAILFADKKPEGAISFQEHKYGCVAAMLSAASKGRTAAFDRKTYGCPGGGVGLGFGNCYTNFPGGIENFLSNGNPAFCETEFGRRIVKQMPHIQDGERYLKSPENAAKMIESLPMQDAATEYVVFQPLPEVPAEVQPQVVVFFVNPDQLTALTVLANYGRETRENVIAPFGSGCQQVGILAYAETAAEQPRAVIGLLDITVRRFFPKDILSFAVPYKMYLEMEGNVESCFLAGREWQELLKRNADD